MSFFYDALLITHFIGLALAVGTGFANMRLALATSDMAPEVRTQFFLRVFALSKNGSIGFALLIASGLGMLFVRGFGPMFALGGGTFHAKLALVVIMIGLMGFMHAQMKRAREAQGGPAMALIPKIGRAMLITGVAIVILAVLSFH
jgi:uncharacterized membrane protein SirB2